MPTRDPKTLPTDLSRDDIRTSLVAHLVSVEDLAYELDRRLAALPAVGLEDVLKVLGPFWPHGYKARWVKLQTQLTALYRPAPSAAAAEPTPADTDWFAVHIDLTGIPSPHDPCVAKFADFGRATEWARDKYPGHWAIRYMPISPDAGELKAIEAEYRKLEAWIKNKHNGYDPECRAAMPALKEPASLIDALDELVGEAAELKAMEETELASKLSASAAQNDKLREEVERLRADLTQACSDLSWERQYVGKLQVGFGEELEKRDMLCVEHANTIANLEAQLAAAKGERDELLGLEEEWRTRFNEIREQIVKVADDDASLRTQLSAAEGERDSVKATLARVEQVADEWSVCPYQAIYDSVNAYGVVLRKALVYRPASHSSSAGPDVPPRPPMLLAINSEVPPSIRGEGLFVQMTRHPKEWLCLTGPNSGTTCHAANLSEVDRTRSDAAALALYDADLSAEAAGEDGQ